MPELFAEFYALEQGAQSASKIRTQLNDIEFKIVDLHNALDWDVRCEKQIDTKLKNLASMVGKLANLAKKHETHFLTALDAYKRAERSNSDRLEAIDNNIYQESSLIVSYGSIRWSHPYPIPPSHNQILWDLILHWNVVPVIYMIPSSFSTLIENCSFDFKTLITQIGQ
jgi:hypothetical protein